MAYRYTLEMITIAAIVIFCLIFFSTGLTMKDADFPGTDSLAAAKMAALSGGITDPVVPLIPQWIPPGPEIESTLFSLQAAIGGILVGGIFGYWIGQRKTKKE
jgi:cobalt transport protein